MKLRVMKFLVTGLLLSAVLFSLTACGSGSASSASGSAAQSISIKEVTRKSGKDEKEILADLNASQDFLRTITDISVIEDYSLSTDYNSTADYTVTEVSITKRKTEPKETDNIYVSVTADSEHTTYTGDYHLLYNYYDVGGWVLDHVELEDDSGQYVPKASVPDDVVASDIGSMLPIDADAVSAVQHQLDGQTDAVTATIDASYTEYSITGTMTVVYDYSCGDWSMINTDDSGLTYTLRPGTYAYQGYTDQGNWSFISIDSSDLYSVNGSYLNSMDYRDYNEGWKDSQNDMDWSDQTFSIDHAGTFYFDQNSIYRYYDSNGLQYDLRYVGPNRLSADAAVQWGHENHWSADEYHFIGQ